MSWDNLRLLAMDAFELENHPPTDRIVNHPTLTREQKLSKLQLAGLKAFPNSPVQKYIHKASLPFYKKSAADAINPRKIRAVYERPGTPGEKAAALSALRRRGIDPATKPEAKVKLRSGYTPWTGGRVTKDSMHGIEVRVAPGREKELGAHLSRAEKNAAKNWAPLSRQQHSYATQEQAEQMIPTLQKKYPHMQYRSTRFK